MATLPDAPLTEEQYLDIERLAEFKSEFHDGRMFAMSGGSLNHALLSAAIGAQLYRQMPPGCRTCSSDLRIKVASAGLYTYPDCSVICGEPQYFREHRDVVLNPLLIVQVLSPSTEDYDRGKRFELYRTVESFREYLIVHQDRRHVEHYSKQDDGSWVLRDYSDGSFQVDRLGVRISLDELYSSALNL
jgi:Uma2 family endonuclease